MDVRNLSIWKEKTGKTETLGDFYAADIADLNLSVRSFNCLRRAGCITVGDVIRELGEDGQGLRRIRNLGLTSEKEILEKIRQYESWCMNNAPAVRSGRPEPAGNMVLLLPGKKTWNRGVEEYPLSAKTREALLRSGIRRISDLYGPVDREPGWLAVRELFEKVAKSTGKM